MRILLIIALFAILSNTTSLAAPPVPMSPPIQGHASASTIDWESWRATYQDRIHERFQRCYAGPVRIWPVFTIFVRPGQVLSQKQLRPGESPIVDNCFSMAIRQATPPAFPSMSRIPSVSFLIGSIDGNRSFTEKF